MKAITIRQPWATLVAIGEKRFETRSWRTDYRGEIAIQAGKKVDVKICRQEPYRSILQKHGYTAEGLPLGAVIAVGRLEQCYNVKADSGTAAILGEDAELVDGAEYIFGDFSAGRYAWEMTDMRLLEEPVSAVGRLGLWNFDHPLRK